MTLCVYQLKEVGDEKVTDYVWRWSSLSRWTQKYGNSESSTSWIHYCQRTASTRGGGEGPALSQPECSTIKPRQDEQHWIHSGQIDERKYTVLYDIRRKTFAKQCLYPVKDLTKSIRLAYPLLHLIHPPFEKEVFSDGNLSPAMGARNQEGIGLSCRPASLCSLATHFQTWFHNIWNRFLDP